MDTKTHYRKVFKSDHLGVADLEDLIESGKKRLVFTVKEVKQEFNVTVAGRKGNHNIAYFKEAIKPMVLNATNSKIMKDFNNGSPFVEDWKNTVVELYIDPSIKLKGEIVGGVRIKPNQPKTEKPELTPQMTEWNKAVDYLKNNGNIESIKSRYKLSVENEKRLKDEI